MSAHPLPVKTVRLVDWLDVVTLFDSFTAIDTYPQVTTNVSAEIVVPANHLVVEAPE